MKTQLSNKLHHHGNLRAKEGLSQNRKTVKKNLASLKLCGSPIKTSVGKVESGINQKHKLFVELY